MSNVPPAGRSTVRQTCTPRVAIEVATGELAGVAHRFGLAGAVTEGVVAVAVLDCACAVHHVCD